MKPSSLKGFGPVGSNGPAPVLTDTDRLNALQANAWELRPYVMLNNAVGWFLLDRGPDGMQHHVIAEVGDRDPRKAIDAAIAKVGG